MRDIINNHKLNSRPDFRINNIAKSKPRKISELDFSGSRKSEGFSRHSQLKIQQMSFMILAVFIFFILVGLFYIVIESQKWKSEANNLEKNKAIVLANFLASSAEFSCGDYCIDADRAMVLSNRTSYRNFFGLTSIEIRKVYPENNKEILCTKSNYPDCNLIAIFNKEQSESTASSFVSLCHRINENDYVYYKCELAKLIAGYNIK